MGVLTGFGPTTVVIHQSAEPFEFHSIYKINHNDVITTTPGRILDESEIDQEQPTTDPIITPTTSSPNCELFLCLVVVKNHIDVVQGFELKNVLLAVEILI